MKRLNLYFQRLPYASGFIILIFVLLISSFFVGCDIWDDNDDENHDNYYIYQIFKQSGIELLESSDTGNAYDPQIAVDSNGNAIAVWWQYDAFDNCNIYSNRYMAGMGWGTAKLIETGLEYASDPQIAMDVNGNGIAVWCQDSDIYSNHYTPDTGWGTEELIGTGIWNASSLQIAMDSNGNAIAVWCQGYSIYSNHYTPSTGWGTEELIGTTGVASFPQIAMDSNGNAIVVWARWDGARGNVWANSYMVGTGWGTAELLETDTGNAWYSQIAMDSNGNAIAVWCQSDGISYNIYSNSYIIGTGWGTAELLETDPGNALYPQIAMNPNGNAIVMWYQYNGTKIEICSNRYIPGTGWGTVELNRKSYMNYDTEFIEIAMDSNGNAIAVWLENNGKRKNIWSVRYTPGVGWRSAKQIETGKRDAYNPQIAIDPNGNSIVVWYKYDGEQYSIYSKRLELH